MFKYALQVWKVIDEAKSLEDSAKTNVEIENSCSHYIRDDPSTEATSPAIESGRPITPTPSRVLPLPVPSGISSILETGLAPSFYIEERSSPRHTDGEDGSLVEGVESVESPVIAPLVLKVSGESPVHKSPNITTRNRETAGQDQSGLNTVSNVSIVVQSNEDESSPTGPSSISKVTPSQLHSECERSGRFCDNISLIAQQDLSNIQSVKQNEGLTEKVGPAEVREDCASRVPSETARRQITRVLDITAALSDEEEEGSSQSYTTLQQLRTKLATTQDKERPASPQQTVLDENTDNVLEPKTAHLETIGPSVQVEVDRSDVGDINYSQSDNQNSGDPIESEIPETQAPPLHVVTKTGELLPKKERFPLSCINVHDGQQEVRGVDVGQPSHRQKEDNQKNGGNFLDNVGNVVISQEADGDVRKDDPDNDPPVSDATQNDNQAEEGGTCQTDEGRDSTEERMIYAEVRVRDLTGSSSCSRSDSSMSDSCEESPGLHSDSGSSPDDTEAVQANSHYLARLDLEPPQCLQLSSLPEMFVDEEVGEMSDVSPISDCGVTVAVQSDLPCDNQFNFDSNDLTEQSGSKQSLERENISQETHQICDNQSQHCPDQPVKFYLRRSETPPIREIDNIATSH